MKKFDEQTLEELKEERKIYGNLYACNEMLQQDGSPKAVLAFYEMIEHFYGKAKTAACAAKYGFKKLEALK